MRLQSMFSYLFAEVLTLTTKNGDYKHQWNSGRFRESFRVLRQSTHKPTRSSIDWDEQDGNNTTWIWYW